MMKKLLTALLVTATGIATVFGQTSFKEESITDVKVQGNKVYFYKETITDSVVCTNTGSKCVIGRTTTLNAEVFQMDEMTQKASPSTNREDWVNFYNSGSMKKESSCGCSEDKKGLWSLNSISYTDSEYFNNSMLLRLSKEHYFTPVLDKKAGKIYGKKIPETGWYLNFALLGIILWAIAIFLGNYGFRVYKLTDENDYSMSNSLLFLSIIFLIISSFYYDSIGWSKLGIKVTMFSVMIVYITRLAQPLKEIFWLKTWYSYLAEFLLMITLFIWLSNGSDHKTAQGIYISIFTAMFFAGSTSLWEKDHNEKFVIQTLWALIKKAVLSPDRNRASRYHDM